MKKKFDFNYKTYYWPKIIMESFNWLLFLDIMKFTADSMKNDKNIFPSLFKKISTFKIKCWWERKKMI